MLALVASVSQGPVAQPCLNVLKSKPGLKPLHETPRAPSAFAVSTFSAWPKTQRVSEIVKGQSATKTLSDYLHVIDEHAVCHVTTSQLGDRSQMVSLVAVCVGASASFPSVISLTASHHCGVIVATQPLLSLLARVPEDCRPLLATVKALGKTTRPRRGQVAHQ